MSLRNNTYPAIEFGNLLQLTIKEANLNRQSLAEHLDCSTDTVDNWCSGRSRISPALLQRLCLFLTEMGARRAMISQVYQKALEAYGLSSGLSISPHSNTGFTLCLLGPLSYHKELLMIQKISNYLRDENRSTLVFHCGDRLDTLISYLDIAEQIGISDYILCGMTIPVDVYRLVLDKLDKRNRSVILALTDCPAELVDQYKNVYAIGWSNFDVAYKATNLLIESGHTNIGTVYLDRHANRFRGYLQALRDKGIDVNPKIVAHGGTLEGYPTITDPSFMNELERLCSRDNFTALFAPTQPLSYAIPFLLVKNGRVPYRDLSFCGVGYPGWIGEGMKIPLTFMSYPVDEVTHRIVDIILRQSLGNDSAEEHYIDVSDKVVRVDISGGSVKQIGGKPKGS